MFVKPTTSMIVPNHTSIEEIVATVFDDGTVETRTYPIPAWLCESFAHGDNPPVRYVSPLSVESAFENGFRGLLLRDGRIVVQEDEEFDNLAAFVVWARKAGAQKREWRDARDAAARAELTAKKRAKREEP